MTIRYNLHNFPQAKSIEFGVTMRELDGALWIHTLLCRGVLPRTKAQSKISRGILFAAKGPASPIDEKPSNSRRSGRNAYIDLE